MANTYTQIHVHIIIVVKYRSALLNKVWREALYKYITGIIQKCGHKLLAVNGVEDHVHILIGMRPIQSLSDLMRLVKGESSEWINKSGYCPGVFRWQEGFAFTNSLSEVPRVMRYIRNQEEHHQKKSFHLEYEEILTEEGVEFEKDYLFKDPC